MKAPKKKSAEGRIRTLRITVVILAILLILSLAYQIHFQIKTVEIISQLNDTQYRLHEKLVKMEDDQQYRDEYQRSHFSKLFEAVAMEYGSYDYEKREGDVTILFKPKAGISLEEASVLINSQEYNLTSVSTENGVRMSATFKQKRDDSIVFISLRASLHGVVQEEVLDEEVFQECFGYLWQHHFSAMARVDLNYETRWNVLKPYTETSKKLLAESSLYISEEEVSDLTPVLYYKEDSKEMSMELKKKDACYVTTSDLNLLNCKEVHIVYTSKSGCVIDVNLERNEIFYLDPGTKWDWDSEYNSYLAVSEI